MRLLLVFLCLAFLGTASAQSTTILVVGDSITAGYGLEEDQAYPALVQASLTAAGYEVTVVNGGLSGDTTAGGRSRLPWLLKRKPDIVLIALGGNDGLRGLPVDQMRDNLTAMIATVREAGAKPALAGMRLPTNYGAAYEKEFFAVYDKVSTETKTPLLPFILEGVGMKPELNQADGIHPTAEGQELVAATVAEFIKGLLDD
jgi:acyl-CoA thioesterase-1